MKKLFFFLLLATSASFGAYAQPTITASNTSLPIGVTDTVYYATGTNPGVAGNGVTWDFSAITLTPVASLQAQAASATPYASNFPTATFAAGITPFGQNTQYDYNIQNSTGLYTIANGYNSSNTSKDFTPNTKLVLPFPFAFGSSVVDTFQLVGSAPDYYTITYGGFGTLKAGGKILNNIVRTRRRDSNGDTSFGWYRLSPLMPVASWNTSGTSIFLLGGSTPNAVEPMSDVIGSVLMVPNPAVDATNLLVQNIPFTNSTCLLRDASGRIVRQMAILGEKTTLAKENLSAGLYFYEVRNANRVLGRGKLIFE